MSETGNPNDWAFSDSQPSDSPTGAGGDSSEETLRERQPEGEQGEDRLPSGDRAASPEENRAASPEENREASPEENRGDDPAGEVAAVGEEASGEASGEISDAVQPDGDRWETLNFPGAIPVDRLPVDRSPLDLPDFPRETAALDPERLNGAIRDAERELKSLVDWLTAATEPPASAAATGNGAARVSPEAAPHETPNETRNETPESPIAENGEGNARDEASREEFAREEFACEELAREELVRETFAREELARETATDGDRPGDAPELAPVAGGRPGDRANADRADEVDRLLSATRTLQQQNGDLQRRVSQLEIALNECQDTLQLQMMRSQTQGSLLSQQSQELEKAQQQIDRLAEELEVSQQAAQRHKILVETLTQNLESSQERVAQLERACAALQSRCTEQAGQLAQSENRCQELRSRLHRQQRQTLQFKAALEKCLELPRPHYPTGDGGHSPAAIAEADFEADFERDFPGETQARQPLLPKADAIPPWSADPVADLAASCQPCQERAARNPEGEPAADPALPELPDASAIALARALAGDSPLPADLRPEDLEALACWAALQELRGNELRGNELRGNEDAASALLASDRAGGEVEAAFENAPATDAGADPPAEPEAEPAAAVPPHEPSAIAALEGPALSRPRLDTLLAIGLDVDDANEDDAPSPVEERLELPLMPQARATEPSPEGDRQSPSPRLYPHRPLKRPASLAAVELPSFG